MAPAGSVGPQDPLPSPVKPKQTCAQCRARKVKCDGRLDFCSNCERLGYDCSFRAASSSDPSQFGTASSASPLPPRPPKGRRVARACTECHLAKSRCTGALPTCQRCTTRNLQCVYEQRSSGSRRQPNSASPMPDASGHSSRETQSPRDQAMPQTAGFQISPSYDMFDVPPSTAAGAGYQQQYPCLTRERVLPAIRKFFEHLHCFPSLAFLHRPSLMRLYLSQGADPALIASIVAVSSRLPGTEAEESEVGFRCADIAEGLVSNTFKQPSIFRLQALLLLLRFRLWTGSPNNPLLLMSYLARSAFLLRLNYETFRSSSFVQESRRRVMWAIYMLDVFLADGLAEYSTCPITTIHLRLPCMEDDFELDADILSERVSPHGTATGWRLGIIGYYIRIIHLNDQILRYIKRLANLRTRPNTADFFRFEEDLADFQSRLPGHERYSQKTLALRAFSPRLARFVMTHVWWHVCHCQLFRPLISSIPEIFSQKLAEALGDALVVEYQRKCLEHALHAVSIISALQNLDSDICVLEMDMAECAFKVSEVLFLSSDSTRNQLGLGRAEALQHASVCLRLTESMLDMYPVLKPMVTDLANALQSFANGAPCFDSPAFHHTSPKQVVTKHSALYRAAFTDDSSKLEIPSASRTQTPALATIGRMPGSEPTPSILFDSQDPGTYRDFTDGNPGIRGSQDSFPWPGDIPDIWDQISLFRGPFDGTELDNAAEDVG